MSVVAKRLDGLRCYWYGGRPRPRRHCVRWGPMQLPHGKGHSSPRPTFCPTARLPISATILNLNVWAKAYIRTSWLRGPAV